MAISPFCDRATRMLELQDWFGSDEWITEKPPDCVGNGACWVGINNPNPDMPLDPVELATGESPRNTPEFIDENPNRDLILQGMNASEDERRDAADDVFGEDPSLPVSDEADDFDDEVAPEIAAIHLERVPDDR